MVSAGTFLSNRSDPVRKLQTYLIDLREGDVPDDPDSIYAFFSSLVLPRTQPVGDRKRG
jgi:hypothetical protein